MIEVIETDKYKEQLAEEQFRQFMHDLEEAYGAEFGELEFTVNDLDSN